MTTYELGQKVAAEVLLKAAKQDASVYGARADPLLQYGSTPLIVPSALAGAVLGAVGGAIPRKQDRDEAGSVDRRKRLRRLLQYTMMGAGGGALVGSALSEARHRRDRLGNTAAVLGERNMSSRELQEVNRKYWQQRDEVDALQPVVEALRRQLREHGVPEPEYPWLRPE